MKKRMPIILISLLAASVFMAGTAQAERPFTALDGGAVGGEGTFGSGSVTVHHNLLEAERQELEDMMASMRSDLTAHINAVDSALKGDIAAVERWAADIEKQAKAAQAEADRAHARLNSLTSRLSAAETAIYNNKIAAANAQNSANNAQNSANNAQNSANNAQNTANRAVTDAYNAHVRANQAYTAAVAARSRADSAYSLAQSAGGNYGFEKYSSRRCSSGDLVLSSGLGGSAENSSDSTCARIVRM